VGLTGGTLLALDKAWYSDYDRGPLHAFNDGGEWLQMDKAGHFFSAYTLGAWGHGTMRHCEVRPSRATLLGGSFGLAFLTGVELLDGTSAAWGFSWWDMAANVAGAGFFMAQQAHWHEQRVRVKLSAVPTAYAEQRPDLLGEGFTERLLKDYNGHTVWLSTNVDLFLPTMGAPKWLNIAVGYGAEGMTSAFPQTTGGGEVRDPRYREFYLSPDMDLTRLPVRSKALRTVLFVLNSIKLPMPALEFSEGAVKGHWLHF